MSEEIKEIILDVKDSLNETPKNMYKYNKITLNLNEFEEILNYIEQLENIRKDAIEYMKEFIFEPLLINEDRKLIMFNENLKNFENILNKGEKNGK